MLSARVVRAEGALLSQVIAAASPAGRYGLNPVAFRRYEAAEARTPWGMRHRRHVALLRGSDVLASAVRYELRGILDQHPIAICGVAVSSTGDEDGGRHAERALLAQLLEGATLAGADLALLYRLPGMPGPAPDGFQVLPTIEVELRVTESSRHGAPMTLVRGGEDRDLDAIAAMGRVRATPARFHLDRPAPFIKHAITRRRLFAGLDAAGRRQLHFVIAEEGITAAAYLVVSVVGRIWTIEECGDRDAGGARVGALLQALLAGEREEPRPTIRGWLPPGFLPPQVTIASAVPAAPILFARALSTRTATVRLSAPDVLYWLNDLL